MRRYYRWTIWNEDRVYADSEAYAAAKRREIDAFDPAWTPARQEAMDRAMARIADDRARSGRCSTSRRPGVGSAGHLR